MCITACLQWCVCACVWVCNGAFSVATTSAWQPQQISSYQSHTMLRHVGSLKRFRAIFFNFSIYLLSAFQRFRLHFFKHQMNFFSLLFAIIFCFQHSADCCTWFARPTLSLNATLCRRVVALVNHSNTLSLTQTHTHTPTLANSHTNPGLAACRRRCHTSFWHRTHAANVGRRTAASAWQSTD